MPEGKMKNRYKFSMSCEYESDKELVDMQLFMGNLVQQMSNHFPGAMFKYKTEFAEED